MHHPAVIAHDLTEKFVLMVPVLLGLGIGIYFALPVEPPLFLAVFLSIVAVAGFVVTWPFHRPEHRFFLLWLLLFAAMLVSLGFSAAKLRVLNVQAPMIGEEIGPVTVQGRVSGLELQDNGGMRLMLKDLAIEDVPADQTPQSIRLTHRDVLDVHVGDELTLLAQLNPPSPPSVPGSFDFQRYAFFKQLGAVGFIYRLNDVQPSETQSWSTKLSFIRAQISRDVYDTLPDARQAGIVTALMTGTRTGISDEDYDAMRAAGLAHMLAISGLHVGLLAGAVFFMARLLLALIPGLALKYPIKKYAAVLAILSAFIYMLLAGASVPTQRAMIMTTIFFLAIILDRSPISMRLVAVAAAAILLWQPESLISVSFQMSFAAVASLVFAYEHTRPYWSAWARQSGVLQKAGLYVLGVLFTTVIASIATAPFALYHFQQTSLVGNIANMIAVPILGFWVMPAMVGALFAFPFGLADAPLWVMGQGTDVILEIAHWTATMDGAIWKVPAWPLSSLICMVLAGLLLIVAPGRWKLLSAAVFLLSVPLILYQKQPDILVSSYSKLIAFRDETGQLIVNSRTTDRFTRENWMRREGLEGEVPARWQSAKDEKLHCDVKGCRLTLKDKRIAFPETTAALAEDCAWADVVIASLPIRRKDCSAPYMIDYWAGKYRGTHKVFINDAIQITADRYHRGSRPWVVFPD